MRQHFGVAEMKFAIVNTSDNQFNWLLGIDIMKGHYNLGYYLNFLYVIEWLSLNVYYWRIIHVIATFDMVVKYFGLAEMKSDIVTIYYFAKIA